jgi:hypothetical protein
LVLHCPFFNRAGQLQQAIGQRTLAVINMSNNAEVSNMVLIHFFSPREDSPRGEFISLPAR